MFRDLLLKNIGWKMLSLGLAVAIWLTVKTAINERGAQSVRTFINIPTQILSSTSDVRTFRVVPDVVSVTVRGRPEVIGVLNEREIHAFVDTTSADISQNFTRRVQVATPIGITIVRVDPVEIAVEVPPKTEPKIIISSPKTNQ
ncbi:MAG: hypothetical protein U1F83_06270 [Verrucomicrobiota bacterium]